MSESEFKLEQYVEKIKEQLRFDTLTMEKYLELLQEVRCIQKFFTKPTNSHCANDNLQCLKNLVEQMEIFNQLPIKIPCWVVCSSSNIQLSQSPSSESPLPEPPLPEPPLPEAPFSDRIDYGYGINTNNTVTFEQIIEQQRQENLRTLELLNEQKEKLRQIELQKQKEEREKEEELRRQELITAKKKLESLEKPIEISFRSFEERLEQQKSQPQKNAKLVESKRQAELTRLEQEKFAELKRRVDSTRLEKEKEKEELKRQEERVRYQCSENLRYY